MVAGVQRATRPEKSHCNRGPRKSQGPSSRRRIVAARGAARPCCRPGPCTHSRSRLYTHARSGHSPPRFPASEARAGQGRRQARPRTARSQCRIRPLRRHSKHHWGPRGDTARPAPATVACRIIVTE
ncbi:hypothetical protein NDU88_008368 [Pleurodeles waltl]|uniref:Uncharacterized protein n=1 Tax=Pleurodeles waltl TaxID=8319 RepID=A0AAV7QUG5_PLEWA|nr:hypothetical protein NDU88_008368 [Pleurodeles waltl]